MAWRRVQSLDPLLLLLGRQCRISHDAQDGLPLGLGGIVLRCNLHYGPWNFATIAKQVNRWLSVFFLFVTYEYLCRNHLHARMMHSLLMNFGSIKSVIRYCKRKQGIHDSPAVIHRLAQLSSNEYGRDARCR